MNSFAIYRDLLNLPDLDIIDVSLSDKEIIIFCCVKSDVTESVCRKCGKLTSCVNQAHVRTIRDLDISGREHQEKRRLKNWFNEKLRSLKKELQSSMPLLKGSIQNKN